MLGPIKILIADDHKLFNEGLKAMLESDSLVIVGQVYTGTHVLPFIHKQPVDLILLDLNLPNLDGIEVARLVKQSFPEIRIILVTTYGDPKFIEIAQEIGIEGYLLKNSGKKELVAAINEVFTSTFYLDPKLFNNAHTDLHGADEFMKRYNLSKREIEIIRLIKAGFTSAEIASRLFLSTYTVDTHRKNIYLKLNLKTIAELTHFAVRNDI